jgi:hypothetical protein
MNCGYEVADAICTFKILYIAITIIISITILFLFLRYILSFLYKIDLRDKDFKNKWQKYLLEHPEIKASGLVRKLIEEYFIKIGFMRDNKKVK